MQNLTAVFDDRLVRVPDIKVETGTDRSLAAYGYRERDGRGQILTLWFDDEIPNDQSDLEQSTPISVTVSGCTFRRPVYVDLLSGTVYSMPEETLARSGDTVAFHGLPVYDSPILVAEQGLLDVQ